ncbi:cysteine--tRNA ligase [Hydrogenothermus marinus]|uniref:Cysteine--tRNA ligase n=1 Tax=Hydrogenothermus marinus TaxID=133270 RepID=A0A3M0BJD0_9AQUI|nr:cysteine--tRNA ligase [Hydrogenothermus marinus]RMA97321.1 cysteinyl-tRNA synthetase [Hydrogenothermus marinus]
MSLIIHNTLTGKEEEFVPIEPGKVRIYVCGVTTYDVNHVGHGRSLIVFDMIRRYLRYLGYEVKFVRNFTDVDDKIINRAKNECVPFTVISDRYIKSYFEDAENFKIEPADIEPRVTTHIPDIIDLIKKLVEKGYAYEVEGDVYFSVRKFKDYGKLSKRSIDELLAGARVEPGDKKKDPLDFALWKAAKAGEPSWDSPWGKGRPGWHTECTAMIFKHLGETIDIHGGGLDLTFPHHENELAQAEAITEKPFAKYWIHNGLVTVNGQKMSKSLGNYITLKEIYSKYHPDILRLLVLSVHYRSPLDFSWEKLEETKKAYERLKNAIEEYEILEKLPINPDFEDDLYEDIAKAEQSFYRAMSEDFNTPEALASLFGLVREMNILKDKAVKEGGISSKALKSYKEAADTIYNIARDIFGFFDSLKPCIEVEEIKNIEKEKSFIDEELIQLLIDIRNKARKDKNFQLADYIRDSLKEKGIILEDTPVGTKWKKEL